MPGRRPLPWLKPAVLTGALVPLAAIVGRGLRGALGANPIAEALNQLGLLALVFLLLALACTPLRALCGWTWPMRIRRQLGLLAFLYAVLHVSTYVGLDQVLDWRAIWDDVTKRRFIFVGFAAFVLLVPLAVTSTDAAVRRLGYARWRRLHRLAYVAPALAAVHFVWRVKKDLREPIAYAVVLGALLLVRMLLALRVRSRRGGPAPAPPPPRVRPADRTARPGLARAAPPAA